MKRINKNPLTTILAALVVFACIALVVLKLATLKEASGFLVIAFGLLFSDDKRFIQNFFKEPEEDQKDSSSE